MPYISFFLILYVFFFIFFPIFSQNQRSSRILPDPYYPQIPTGELRLNYYYDRTGKWVKFSNWIPYLKKKYTPRHLEDFYGLYSLDMTYDVHDLKEGIYFLHQALSHKFRHPSDALCKITNPNEYHKYRLLMFMHINQLIMRLFLRLGAQYDKSELYFYDLDFTDGLERSFLIAQSYYKQAIPFWKKTIYYAKKAHAYPFELDLPTIESNRFQIINKELNFNQIIYRHLSRIQKKLKVTKKFLDKESRPRPVKSKIQKDIENMYDPNFTPSPLFAPRLGSDTSK